MELFKKTNIDFIGRRWYFIGLSIVLIVAGVISMIAKGGLKLGIDFKGGTLVYVKFNSPPRVEEIRHGLTAQGLSVATLQPFEDGNELKIDLDLPRQETLSTGKEQIVATLQKIYGSQPDKLDFNNSGPDTLADRLHQDSALTQSLSNEQITKSAQALITIRDEAPFLGIIRDFAQLKDAQGVDPAVLAALPRDTYLGEFAIRGVEAVGPKIGHDLQLEALKATLAALGAMGVYLAFRFEWIYGAAAVLAVFHDVLVTLGFFSIFNRAIDLTVIAALLTLVGYSVNDTIVIFDRMRENLKLTRRMPLEKLMNESVNQTLSRTLLTSGLTFIAVMSLFLFGGEVLRGFSFALVVGVIVGTYSSIFVASPIVLWWRNMVGERALGRGTRTVRLSQRTAEPEAAVKTWDATAETRSEAGNKTKATQGKGKKAGGVKKS